jgi:hypothetical protein
LPPQSGGIPFQNIIGETMKNLFRKSKAEPKAKAPSKLTRVYIKDYRKGGIMNRIVQPGVKHPEVAEFMDTIPIPYNSPAALANAPGIVRTPGGQTARLVPKTINVVFRDGMAEVSQPLATFLIGEEQCFAKPQKPCNWTDPTRYAAADGY